MRVLIDDYRNDNEHNIPRCDVILRTPMAAIDYLVNSGIPEEIYLDHDMGEGNPIYVTYDGVSMSVVQSPEEVKKCAFFDVLGKFENSGYGVLCFIEYCIKHYCDHPKLIKLFTANGSARDKMRAALSPMFPNNDGVTFRSE